MKTCIVGKKRNEIRILNEHLGFSGSIKPNDNEYNIKYNKNKHNLLKNRSRLTGDGSVGYLYNPSWQRSVSSALPRTTPAGYQNGT